MTHKQAEWLFEQLRNIDRTATLLLGIPKVDEGPVGDSHKSAIAFLEKWKDALSNDH